MIVSGHTKDFDFPLKWAIKHVLTLIVQSLLFLNIIVFLFLSLLIARNVLVFILQGIYEKCSITKFIPDL